MVVAQTNEQVDDLIDRLAIAAPKVTIGRLSASTYTLSQRVTRHESVLVSGSVNDVADRAVVIGTAAKWATVEDGEWDRAIVDEAYQMRSDMLLRVAGRFARGLFVGDPGQLDPFSVVALERWAGLTWDPMQSAVSVLLRHNPDLPVHRLPVSWRLPATAAKVVSAAFYPFAGFSSGTTEAERRLTFTAPAASTVDKVLDTAAASGWALLELPARHTVRTDREAVLAVAEVVRRLLERGPIAYSARSLGGTTVIADRIAVG